ncbi:hypothetical protein [Thalassobaculum sp.]|uniref:hypothetical protein n=1 Tax=Thalassobaculum sp. TaxID=2022740 RepID=UPI0032EC9715
MTPIPPLNFRTFVLPRLGRVASITALVALMPLTACVPNPLDGFNSKPEQSTASAKGRSSEQPVDTGATAADTFKQFNDIPIPADADIDLEQSLVLGTEDGWIGRLSLDVGYVMIDMYAFYTKEMPRFGWEQLTTVRARISTMTYRRGSRVATITMQPHSGLQKFSNLSSGTTIDFTVAPANRSVIDSGKKPAGG